jgi:hypothetical protein
MRQIENLVPDFDIMQDGFAKTRLTKPIKLVNNKIHDPRRGRHASGRAANP